MKKLMLLFFALTLFTACSDDDDNGSEDQIVGTWFLVEANNFGDIVVDDCSSKSSITFNSDNTTSSKFYTVSNGSCELSEDSSTWSSNGSRYTIDIPGVAPLSGSVTFSDNNTFTFYPDIFVAQNSNLVFEKR